MRKVLKIAFRNIFRQKKRTFSLGLTYTFATILLILIISFSYSSVENIKTNLSVVITGDLNLRRIKTINNQNTFIIENYNKIEKLIKKVYPDSRIFERFSAGLKVYFNGYSKNEFFKGIKLSKEKKFKSQIKLIKGNFKDFENNEDAILVPSSEADYFEFKIGDQILVSVKTLYGAYNTGIFTVKGIYRSSNLFSQMGFIAHHDYLRKLLNMPENSTESLDIYFSKKVDLNEARNKITEILEKNGYNVYKVKQGEDFRKKMRNLYMSNKKLDGFYIFTIDEILSQIKQLSSALNTTIIVIAVIMFLIISVSIFINIRMTINDRMREIGTMRTIGLKKSELIKMFVLENFFLGILFTFVGIIISFILMIIISSIKINSSGDFSVFLNNGHITFYPKPAFILILLVIIGLFSIIFSYIPSKYAGKIRPVEALRKVF